MIKITLTIKQRQDGQADFIILPESTLHTETEMKYAKTIQDFILIAMESLGADLSSNDTEQVKEKLKSFEQKTN